MSQEARELLMAVFKAYNEGNEYCISTPPSDKIHDFNMAAKEIKDYIVFTRRDMLKISITLSEMGLEYVLDNGEFDRIC